MTEDSRKNRCLIILPRKIFPLIGGYANYRKNLIEILNKYYFLTIIIISNSEISDEEKYFFEANSVEYKYFTFNKLNYLFNSLKGFLFGEALQVGYFYFRKVQKEIDKLIPNQDIVIGSLIRSMKYLEKCPKEVKVINDMADSMSLNYKNSKKKVSSFFWRLIYTIEIKRLDKYERFWLTKANLTTVFNAKECNILQQYGNVIVVPHGVNKNLTSYNKINSKYAKSVVFMGKMDYQPNIDAVIWYLKNVHSKICEDVPFIIVGAYPTKKLQKLSKKYKNLTITGFVEDPFEIVQSSMAVVSPMQTGAGIQNKILESMALGTINIITSLSANPIVNAENNKHFIVANNSEEFINIITEIKKDSNKFEIVKKSSREFIINNYTWDAFENKYINEIKKLCSVQT